MSIVDVVIVGAGAAGIAAARRLLAAKKTVCILEARNRAGGRAVTDHSLGCPVDLGAAWLHFARENAWTDLAQSAGLKVIRQEPGWGAVARIGQQIPTAEQRAAIDAAYGSYYAAIAAAGDAGLDIPISHVIPQDRFRARFDAIMTWAVGVESEQVSTLDLNRYADSLDNWAIQEGLGTTVALAAHHLPIRFETVVNTIDWQQRPIRLHTSQGVMEAGAVIVTVPTSVLAGGRVKFTPPLPDRHRSAIENIPLGVANKVFFRAPPEAMPFLQTTHVLARDDNSRTTNLLFHAAAQPVICAYFGGDFSKELEDHGELAPFALAELRRLYGARFADSLSAPVTTGWGSDPYAQGSYSAARPGHAHARQWLAEPVTPQLLFAGEACSEQYFGTLHGAWLSGVQAAETLTG
jgi:monoamine oxidase